MPSEDYKDYVGRVEENLGPWAKKSFETCSEVFVDGANYFGHYQNLWDDPDHRMRISNRTPLQAERDRILYSRAMRKLTEKYHVLYSGDRRIIRNFTTHTMRMAQVARAISNGLRLNADFSEAIALGAKVGAPPFVHASKKRVATWICDRLADLDRQFSLANQELQPDLFPVAKPSATNLPSWMQKLSNEKLLSSVGIYMPWATGPDISLPYSSGSQGYWSLATDPYLVQSRPRRFAPETMFGIWRHSLGLALGQDSFVHSIEIEGASSGRHEIRWNHVTYEAMVVAYADDITWVIENLDDANRASLLTGGPDIYLDVLADLREHGKVPVVLNDALLERDSGGLYNFFITDFVVTASDILSRLGDGAVGRQALRDGTKNAAISLSEPALIQLSRMKEFLRRRVFSEARVENRFKILETITEACLDLLYRGRPDALDTHVKNQTRVLNFGEEKMERVTTLLRNPVHRIQLAVDIFSEMSDQEIYDFVGIQGL